MSLDLQFKAWLEELRRRRVFRVAVVYLAVGWVLLQVADLTFPLLGLPTWTSAFVLLLLLVGFPVALVLAWAVDLTPEGIRRAPPGGGPESAAEAPGLAKRGWGRRLATTGVVLFLVAAGAWMAWRGRREPLPPASPMRLAVFPFSVHGSDALGYLDEGMVDLLSTKLDGVGELRTVDPQAVLSALGGVGGEVDAERGRLVARRLGAGLYVRGSVVAVGPSVQLNGLLYDLAGGPDPVAEATAEGTEDEIFQLVDRLAGKLVAERTRGPRGRLTRLATLTTSSLPALKAYLEGEAHLRAGRYEAAIEALERAVADDTTFALAYYRLASAAAWVERARLQRQALEQALWYGDRLPRQERMLVDALLAQGSGAHVEAERRLRELVGMYPDDIEAWYRLGDLILHDGDLMGYTLLEAGPAFDRSLELDPAHAPTLFHASNIAARAGDLGTLDSLTRRFLGLEPDSASVRFLRAQRALAEGDTAALTRAVLDYSSADEALYDVLFAVWSTRRLRGGQRLAEALVRPGRPAPTRVAGHVFRAVLETGRGRPNAGREELRAAAALEPVIALEYEALLALAPLSSAPEPYLRSLRERLLRAESVVTTPLGSPESDLHDPLEGLHGEIRTHLLGLIDSRLGEGTAAERHASALDDRAAPEPAPGLPADLARVIRAAEARRLGKTAEALAILERASFWTEDRLDERFSAFSAHAYAKHLRAELLRELGRDAEALRWYAVSGEWPFELHYLAPSHLRRGELYERAGDPERARSEYARVLELWREAEPELRPLIVEVEGRLARLGSDAGSG